MSLYDIPDYEAALAALSVSNYINALKVSGEKCLQFHYSHLYHESFDKLPSPTLPFGIIRRVPCDAVVIFIAQMRKAMTPSDRERLRERCAECGDMLCPHLICHECDDCDQCAQLAKTGQTEEETSDGRDERLAVAGNDDSQRDSGILSGGNRNDTNPQAPLTSQSASAPDWPECDEEFYNLMQHYRHTPITYPIEVRERYEDVKHWLREGASSFGIHDWCNLAISEGESFLQSQPGYGSINAATLKELADFKQMSEYWETRYGNARRTWQQQINDEQNAHEKIAHFLIPLVGTADGTSVSAAERAAAEIEHLEAERDSLREAIRELQQKYDHLSKAYDQKEKLDLMRDTDGFGGHR